MPVTVPYRWVMLALTCSLYFAFGLCVASLAPVVVSVRHDLGLSAVQMGTILGTWQLVYIGAAWWGGLLVDRVGLRWAMALGAGLMALSVFLRSTSVGFAGLMAAVALFGLGGPMISTGVPKMVSLWFPPRERGQAIGLALAASPTGNVVALAGTHSLFLPLFGHWRAVFVAFSLLTAVLAVLWLALARDPDQTATHVTDTAHLSLSDTLRQLLKVNNVRLVLLGAVLVFAVSHGMLNWLPFMLQTKGFSTAAAGYWAALAGASAALASGVVPRLVPPQGRIRALVLVAMALGASVAGVGLLPGGWAAAAALGTGLTRNLALPLWFLVFMDTPAVGPRLMGAAGGLFFVIGEIGGFAGPALFGLLLQLTGSIHAGALVLAALALLVATVNLGLDPPEPQRAEGKQAG